MNKFYRIKYIGGAEYFIINPQMSNDGISAMFLTVREFQEYEGDSIPSAYLGMWKPEQIEFYCLVSDEKLIKQLCQAFKVEASECSAGE